MVQSKGMSDVVEQWRLLATSVSSELAQTRLQLHWAAQALAAVGEGLVPAEADFSHTSLSWEAAPRRLASQTVPGGARVALSFGDLALHVLSGSDARASRPLTRTTLEAALRWLEETLASSLGRGPVTLQLPEYQLPAHEIGRGGTFAAALPEAEELADWYSNAAVLQSAIRDATPGASPVRCWPHHFDIATLIQLDPDAADPESARSIGVGMSPGDATIDQPYFYVNPWPQPQQPQLPPLEGGGVWHRGEWIGAVLPCSDLAGGSAAHQAEAVVDFVHSAIAAERTLLGA